MELAFAGLPMTGLRERREPRAYVDFASVPVSQWKMHDRLENWGKWCHGSQKQTGTGSPMFNLYQSGESQRRRYGEEVAIPVDKDDALKIHFAIVHPNFPDHQRRALQWSYLRPRDPAGKAKELGVDLNGLKQLVEAGRATLIQNRA